MKKLFLTLAMLMMLAVSSVCSAANGKMLSAEEMEEAYQQHISKHHKAKTA